MIILYVITCQIYVIKNTMRFKSDKYKTKIILNKNKKKMLE